MRHLFLTAALCATPLAAFAETAWNDIRHTLWQDRAVADGSDLITLDAPYRSTEDARTVIGATVTAPPGLRIGEVTLILDDNPMPVSAVVSFDVPQERVHLDATFRVNMGMPVRAVVEPTDGQLFAVEQFVKTSGQGACAAPPGSDPVLALETLGDMQLSADAAPDTGAASRLSARSADQKRLAIDISHPSHSGLQKDQVSLLFIPMRYVHTLDVDVNGGDFATITGSISFSENPEIGLSIPADTQEVSVTLTDTDDAVATAQQRFAGF